MKMKGTVLAIMMSLVMVFAMMPMMPIMAGAAYADSEVEYDGVKYTLHDNGEATVIGYDGVMDNIFIPSKVNFHGIDYAVTSIGDYAFITGRFLTAITIPESVTSIGHHAFSLCSNLETVTFVEGSKLESIEEHAFEYTRIKSITIPENVTSIGKNAFEGTELTSIILPEGITVISEELFQKCRSLKEINIPSTVGEIQSRAFNNCNALEKIYFGGSMSQWKAITGNGKPAITPIFCANAPAGKTLIHNGKVQIGVDSNEGYTLSGTVSAKAAGSYQAIAALEEGYIWSDGTTEPKTITWTIKKANNPLSIKGRTVKVKYKKLKKKNQKLAVTKVIKFTKKGQGKLTYTKASGNKKITIAKTTGKVTVKKGLKKGTYKIKVSVKAAGNANYNASAVKAVTFKVRVK